MIAKRHLIYQYIGYELFLFSKKCHNVMTVLMSYIKNCISKNEKILQIFVENAFLIKKDQPF